MLIDLNQILKLSSKSHLSLSPQQIGGSNLDATGSGQWALDNKSKYSNVRKRTWAGDKLKQITLCTLYWDVLSSEQCVRTTSTTLLICYIPSAIGNKSYRIWLEETLPFCLDWYCDEQFEPQHGRPQSQNRCTMLTVLPK